MPSNSRRRPHTSQDGYLCAITVVIVAEVTSTAQVQDRLDGVYFVDDSPCMHVPTAYKNITSP